MPRLSRPYGRRRRRGPDANLLAGLALAALAVAGGGALLTGGAPEMPPVRDHAGCLPDAPAVEVVAFDAAARVAPAQREALPALLSRRAAALPADGRLELHRLDAEAAFRAAPRLVACAPAAATPTSDSGAFAAAAALSAPSESYLARTRARDADRLREAVQALIETPPSREPAAVAAPVAASIATLAGSPALVRARAAGAARLTLVSDLAEDPAGALSPGSLSGLLVDVVFVTGPDVDAAAADRREAAWRAALAEAGARVAVVWTRLAAPPPAPRDAFGCRMRPEAELLVLFDETAAYAPGQVARLREALHAALSTLGPGEVVELHRLGETPAAAPAVPALRLCAPEAAPGAEALDAAARDRFLAEAVPRLDAGLAGYGEGDATPLLADVAAVFAGRDAAAEAGGRAGLPPRRRAILFTDGLVNAPASGGLTFWDNGRLTFAQAAERPAVRRALVDLAGLEVRVLYARRDARGWSAFQNQTHRTFLADWLQAQGATLDAAGVEEIKEP